MKLSPRLQALADFVIPGSIPADIGTDHAFLPIYLVSEGKCPQAIASDLNPGPYKIARETVTGAGLAAQIDVRRADGITGLKPGEADSLIIAGMGGGTIREILKAAPGVLAKVNRLVLQPMVDGGALRLWLAGQGWYPVDEVLVEDEGRIYEVMAVERMSAPPVLEPLILELGPRLIEKKDPLLVSFVEKIISAYTEILSGLAKSHSDSARAKEKEIKLKVQAIKEVLSCRLNVKL